MIRGMNEGRAFVIIDGAVPTDSHRYIQTVLRSHQMQARIHTTSNTVASLAAQKKLAAQLAGYAGGALVSVGHSGLIAAGKAIATLAANGPGLLTSNTPGLRVAPRTHIAIPVGLGTAVECTDTLTFADTNRRTVVDERLVGPVLLDHRLFGDDDPDKDDFVVLAMTLAACTVTNPSHSLRGRTLALTAANLVAGDDPRPVDVRTALAYATAAHSDYQRCGRCAAGTVTVSTLVGVAYRSPAHICLQQALARAGRANRSGLQP